MEVTDNNTIGIKHNNYIGKTIKSLNAFFSALIFTDYHTALPLNKVEGSNPPFNYISEDSLVENTLYYMDSNTREQEENFAFTFDGNKFTRVNSFYDTWMTWSAYYAATLLDDNIIAENETASLSPYTEIKRLDFYKWLLSLKDTKFAEMDSFSEKSYQIIFDEMKKLELVEGDYENFRGDQRITLEEAMDASVKLISTMGELRLIKTGELSLDLVGVDYKNTYLKADQLGLLSLYYDEVNPKKYITKGEASYFIYQISELLKK